MREAEAELAVAAQRERERAEAEAEMVVLTTKDTITGEILASAAEEQTAVAEEISRNITNISAASDSTVAGSAQTAETTEHLKSLSEQLHQVLNDFSQQQS